MRPTMILPAAMVLLIGCGKKPSDTDTATPTVAPTVSPSPVPIDTKPAIVVGSPSATQKAQPAAPMAKLPTVGPAPVNPAAAPVGGGAAAWVAKLEDDLRAREASEKMRWEESIGQARANAERAREEFKRLVESKSPFSKQKAARAVATTAEAALHKLQATPPVVAATAVPAVGLDQLRVGQFGRINTFDQWVKVFQIIGPDDLIAHVDLPGTPNDVYVWVQMKTAGLADRDRLRVKNRLAEGTGTRSYTSVLGANLTVHAVRFLEDVALPEPRPIAAQLMDRFDALPPASREPINPPDGWAGGWKQIGQVKVRVSAADYAPAPVLDGNEDRQFSPNKMLLLWVEVRNEGSAARTYQRYQWGTICTLNDAERRPFGPPVYPKGAALDDATPARQQLAAGATVRTLIAFNASAPPTQDVELALDAARVGESGRFELRIPAAAWKR